MPRTGSQRRQKRFLTMRQLRERWGNCSHMTVERRMEDDPNFPRPIRPGLKARTRLWDEEQIEAYERASVVSR